MMTSSQSVMVFHEGPGAYGASKRNTEREGIAVGALPWDRMVCEKRILGVQISVSDLDSGESEQPGVIPGAPLILAEAKVAAPRNRHGRVSGLLAPRIQPLKTTKGKFGTTADRFHLGRGVAPVMATAGVIVTNPVSQPGGIGTGYITVVWTASQAGLANQANWWVNPASPHPIPTNSFPLAAGNATVTFGPLAGYTPPAPVGIHIWKGQVTTLTVTYG